MSCWRVEEGQDKDDWCLVGVCFGQGQDKGDWCPVEVLCALKRVKTRGNGVLLKCCML